MFATPIVTSVGLMKSCTTFATPYTCALSICCMFFVDSKCLYTLTPNLPLNVLAPYASIPDISSLK